MEREYNITLSPAVTDCLRGREGTRVRLPTRDDPDRDELPDVLSALIACEKSSGLVKRCQLSLMFLIT